MHYLVTCYGADAIHVRGEGAKCKKRCSRLLGIEPQASVSVEIYFHLPVRSKTRVLRERIIFPRLEKMTQSAQTQAPQITLDIHEATGDISPSCEPARGFAMRTDSSKWCSGLRWGILLVLTAPGLPPGRKEEESLKSNKK